MPGSSISLESLSSPSPSPSPTPPRAKGSATHKAQAAQAKAAPPHGLGSDSELSELTEEEQDGAEKRANPPNAPHGDHTATGDESVGGTSVGGGASISTSASLSRRAAQTMLSTTGKRRRGRKKRSSLVPAPMWDWAGSKTNKEQEEEEEEEMPGPPEVMEEEEDEEEGEVEEEDKEKGTGSHHPAPTPIVRKSKGKKVASRAELGGDVAMEVDVPRGFEPKLNGTTALPQGIPGSSAGGNEEEEEEAESEEGDSAEDKNIQSQSDEASDSDGPKWTVAPVPVRMRTLGFSHRKIAPRRHTWRRSAYVYTRPCPPEEKNPWKFSEDEEDDSASSKGSDDEDVEDEEDTENENEKDEGDLDKEDNDRDPPAEDVDPPETMQVVGNYPNPIISSAALKATSSPPNSLARVVDQTGPLVEAIAPIAAAAAAMSIMAGSQVIDPASPSTSTFSRLHSPDPTSTKNVVDSLKKKNVKVKEGDYDGSLAVPKAEKKEKISKHAPPALDTEIDPPELEGDGDNEPSGAADADEPEVEQEQEVDVENELETVEAEEPSPDDDLEVELESDLQPAHRAEALDVLATIELKFALLRERVYVEKMEGLAWEEKLVNEGTHPELIHIQKELLKRRDRRLELASRKREYELANISKKRRTNEDSTWSWWKLARDDLQTDMVAETNRKRRRLERERRASEKPQPVPYVPMPPSEVPPAPSLRKIVKSFPFVDKQKMRNSQITPKPGDYPELLGLTPSEINTDLEVFFSGRRGYDFRGNPVVGFPAPIPPTLGFPGYETYPDHMGNPMVPPGRIHPQHVPPFTHQMQPPQNYAYPSPSSGRMPPPSGHAHPLQQPPPPPPLHAGLSGSGMYPMDEMMGPIPHSVPPHAYYGSQVNGGPYPESAPPLPASMIGPPGPHGRRSPSPMGAVVNGKQPHSGWMGPGVPPGAGGVPVGQVGYPGPGHGRSKGEWVPGDDRRRDYPIGSEEEEGERMMRERAQREDRREFFDRERDKQREQRDKERDRESMMMDMDRERHMQMMAQHRQGPPASGPPPSAPIHPHVHGMPSQHLPMVGHLHSRPHHHHVVHHHHHHGTSGPGGPLPPASVMHSPRAPREYGETGPGSGHGQYPTEIINLSSKLGPPPSHRDDYPSNRELDFREKDNREKERARISRRSSPVPGSSSQSQSQSQGPLQPPLVESDRPISTPFAMASTQTMQASSSANGTSSPRLPSAYDGHLRSPGHRFSSTGRSVPPTAGPSTPSAVPPPSLPSSANSGQRDGSALSSPRRAPPLQSPSLLSESLRERDPEGMGGSSSGVSMVPSSSPVLQGQRSPGPVKFGPPPPMTLGSSTNVAERDRVSGVSTSGMSGAKGPFIAAVRASAVGSKARPGSPIGQVAKAVNQPSVNPKVGLSGPGRAGTPVEIERKGPFTSPSARSANGVVGGFDGDERDRDREREKHRMLEEAKLMAGPGPLTPPTSLISSANASAPTSSPVALTSPSKMSVPQMVDGP